MGAEPAAGGTDQWFGYYDDTVVGDPCSEADHAFLAGLRARAVSHRWRCDPADTFSHHDDELGERALKVGVWRFERLLAWPIERREWLGANGELVYHGWVLPDIEEKLVVDASWPPERRPDRVVLVRGNRDRRARAARKRRRTPSWPWRRRGGA